MALTLAVVFLVAAGVQARVVSAQVACGYRPARWQGVLSAAAAVSAAVGAWAWFREGMWLEPGLVVAGVATVAATLVFLVFDRRVG